MTAVSTAEMNDTPGRSGPIRGSAPAPMLSAEPRVRVRLRITTRGRRVLAALVAVPIVMVAFLFALNGGSATATSESGALEYVTVEAGQSLWSLAESIAPQDDPRDVIDEILTLNGLTSAQVQAGQMLAVPREYLD